MMERARNYQRLARGMARGRRRRQQGGTERERRVDKDKNPASKSIGWARAPLNAEVKEVKQCVSLLSLPYCTTHQDPDTHRLAFTQPRRLQLAPATHFLV
jgi:hypothetical protein